MDKKILEDYALMEQRIRTKKERIRKLKSMKAQLEHSVVRGSNQEFPYEPRSFHESGYNIQADERQRQRVYNLTVSLEKDVAETQRLRLEVEEFIEGITDATDQLIFSYIYLEGLTQEQTARKLHMDRSRVSRRISKYFPQK